MKLYEPLKISIEIFTTADIVRTSVVKPTVSQTGNYGDWDYYVEDNFS